MNSITKLYSSTFLRAMLVGLLVFFMLATRMSSEVYASGYGVETSDREYIGQLKLEDGDPEANLTYLFAVFIITWGGFFAYAFVLSHRQREIRRDMETLKSMDVHAESVSEGKHKG